MRDEEFVNYLGVDYERKGGRIRITCPFHEDRHPSMLIYPELERGAYCFPCGTACSWAWLAHKIKGIPYTQALKELGQEVLPAADKKYLVKPPEKMGFCEVPKKKFADAFTEKHEKCSTEWPDKMVEWLKKKKLDKVAKELDWRWHDGNNPQFRNWGDGIVIPYKIGSKVVYERFRAWNGATMKFDKPKGPFDVEIQPYITTFRPNSVVCIAEGESDCASLYAHGASAIGIPGASAKKAINTVVAFLCDRSVKKGGYVDTICACGDKDEAGQKMNRLIREAVYEICEGVNVIEYTPESADLKADVNDDHAAGLLKVPVEFTANYGDNYNRQPWADKDFGEYVDKLSPLMDKLDGLRDRYKELERLSEEYTKKWEENPANKGKDILEDTQFKVYFDEMNRLWDEGVEVKKEMKKLG